VHHAVDHYCPSKSEWVLTSCGVATSVARQLRTPLFVTDLKALPKVPDEVDLANELLAEAQVAIFRQSLRLAVLNSFTAVETLANTVYKRSRKTQLISWGVPETEAETIAENERKTHRTDERFLLGVGMKQ